MKLRNINVTHLAVYIGRMYLSMLLCVFWQRVGGEMTQKRRRAEARAACSMRSRYTQPRTPSARRIQMGRNTAVEIVWMARRMVRL